MRTYPFGGQTRRNGYEWRLTAAGKELGPLVGIMAIRGMR